MKLWFTDKERSKSALSSWSFYKLPTDSDGIEGENLCTHNRIFGFEQYASQQWPIWPEEQKILCWKTQVPGSCSSIAPSNIFSNNEWYYISEMEEETKI